MYRLYWNQILHQAFDTHPRQLQVIVYEDVATVCVHMEASNHLSTPFYAAAAGAQNENVLGAREG